MRFDPYIRRNKILKRIGYQSYKQYLESDLWKKIRQSVMDAYKNTCVICKRRATQAHHVEYSYPSLIGKSPWYLVALCENCHKSIEFFQNGDKASLAMVNAKLKHDQTIFRRHTKVAP